MSREAQEPLGPALRVALAAAVRGLPEAELARATAALVARYRSVAPAGDPILGTPAQVAAYAVYRMPATHAVLLRVLSAVAEVAGEALRPRSVLDLGGGTGAAAWAAAECFPSIEAVTVLDQVEDALALGRSLAGSAPSEALHAARFERARLDALPEEPADLVTISYVLSELDEAEQDAALDAALRRGSVVVVAEPGTPDGYARVLRARDRLLRAGWRLLGPCPHEQACPLQGRDWCHFSVRLARSVEHRRVKGAQLSYEDEKYSWVAAARPDLPVPQERSGRILRHPLKRKGLVEFHVCRPDGTAGREVVSKRAGSRYRAAREAQWGDTFPGE